MSDGPSILLESARTYLARGYAVIPVPARKKIPVLKGWTDLRLSESDLPAHFNGTGNIGVLLGEPSGWLVDVDLDCEEAVALAPKFLAIGRDCARQMWRLRRRSNGRYDRAPSFVWSRP